MRTLHPGRIYGTIRSKLHRSRGAEIPTRSGRGWPRLNSEKRLWVAHPCVFGFARVGSFSFPFSNFYFLLGRSLGTRSQRRWELARGQGIEGTEAASSAAVKCTAGSWVYNLSIAKYVIRWSFRPMTINLTPEQ